MECEICFLIWDSEQHIPRLLPCGHTFCELCLVDIANQAKQGFFCPLCMYKLPAVKNAEDVLKLPKNFTLLKISSKIEQRKTITGRETNFNLNTAIFKDNRLKRKFTIFDEKSICEQHNKVLHTAVIGTSMMFCDDCKNDKGLKTMPLPGFINNLKECVSQSKNRILMNKAEIERIKEFFESYQGYSLTSRI